MFEALTGSIGRAIDRIRMRGKLTRENIEQGMREVRSALLEADVSFGVVKQFLAAVTEKAVGEAVVKSVDPSQQIVKVVHDELVALMGPGDATLRFAPTGITAILMAGLQGSGKTTTCAKLARLLAARGRHPLLVAADVQRPAAVDQLEKLGAQIGLPVYSDRAARPPAICKRSLEEARRRACDTVILDTAGRLHVDEEMMAEVAEVAAVTNPLEVLLVADAMTGQDAATSAKAFAERLRLTGVVLTKLDGDARGGAALSVRAISGVPVKFVGVGEKIDQLEEFHPERMADRILGMGDVVSLVERAQKNIDRDEAQRLAGKMIGGGMTLEDFMQQLRQVRKMGSVKDLMAMIPGVAGMPQVEKLDDRQFLHMEALISSMTPDERAHPEIVQGTRKRRVAEGSGRPSHEVGLLLRQFRQMKRMFGRIGRSGGWAGLLGNLPPEALEAPGEAPETAGPAAPGALPMNLFSRGPQQGRKPGRKKR